MLALPQHQHPCSPQGLCCPPVSIPCPRVPPGSGSSSSRSAVGAGPAQPGLPGRSSSSAGPFPPAPASASKAFVQGNSGVQQQSPTHSPDSSGPACAALTQPAEKEMIGFQRCFQTCFTHPELTAGGCCCLCLGNCSSWLLLTLFCLPLEFYP